MDKFVKSLKKKYREKLFFTEKQWLKVSGDKLINLQLVEADKKEGFCGGLPQHSAKEGTVKRTRIVSEDIFSGEKPVKKVLVEGNGGMGKTTLCTMITEGWAEEKMLTQFKCLVFLPLREGDVASAESVSDLLKLLHGSEKICTFVESDLEGSEGEGLLIIADGWDELGKSKRCKRSFLYQLLFGKVLPFASVLLTSRPSASADLHELPCVDRLVEVVGFNEDNIKQYIECEFEKCPEKACGLIERLANNPLIQSVCSVPLNCAITCNLWYTLDQQLPTTLTELYTLIIRNVILWNIKKLPDVQSTLSLKSFDSIPSQLELYWWRVCEFAFESLSRDQLVFTEEEVASLFPERFDSCQQFLYFGLLQSAHSLLPVGHGLSFHFLHLTFQEYLAALHLVTLPIEEQIEVVKEYGETSRFNMVWRFFFGLGSDKQSVSSRYVSKRVVCLDEKMLQKFLSFNVSNSRTLLSHCALESCNTIVSYQIAQRLSDKGRCTIFCRNPYDYVAVLHVLSHTSHCKSISLNLTSCGLTDKLLDRLTDILSSALGKPTVRWLKLDSNKLTGRGISALLNKASVAFSSIHYLSLSNNSLHGDSVDSIVSSLIHTSFKSLSELSLYGNPLGVSGIQALERAAVAGVLVNLRWLQLSNTLTSDSDVNGVLLTTLSASVSSHCPHLTGLGLSENNLGVPGACALGEALPLLSVSKSQFSVTLCNAMLDDEAISAFTDCLESSSKLTSRKFLIHHNGSQSQSRSSNTLDVKYNIDLGSNPLEFSGALALMRLLISEACLITELDLSKTDITTGTNSDSLVDLFAPATSNYSLTSLHLNENNLCGGGVHLLVKFMNICQSLKYLYCVDCKLTSEDIRQVLSLLKSTHSTSSCSKLEMWNLSANNIDDVCVAALIEYIPDRFPSLQCVYLDDNPVSDEIIQRLEECLEVNRKRIRTEEVAEKDTRRDVMLYEWVITQSLPQDQQLLEEFMEMWNELLREMRFFIECVIQERTASAGYSNTIVELSPSPQPTVPEPSTSPPPPSSPPIRPDKQMSASESSSVCPVVESPVRLTPQGPERSETGVPDLTLNTLTVELERLTKPIVFGIYLNVPQSRLEIIEQNNPHDIERQKIALFIYLASNSLPLCLSWTKIVNALKNIHGDLASSIRQKYCCELEEPANVSEQPTSQSVLTITALQNEFNLTDEQIDRPIEGRDLFYLGGLFGAWRCYAGMPGLGLSDGEQHTIHTNLDLIDNAMKVKEALTVWQHRNPLTATFRNLLNTVLELRDGGVAKKISEYVNNLKYTDSFKHSDTIEELSLSPQPTVPEPSTSPPQPSSPPVRPDNQMSASESSSVCPVVESPVRLAPQGPERSETDGPSLDIDLETVDNSTELDEEDTLAITEELSGLEADYYCLGLALGFPPGTMNRIRRDSHYSCREALSQLITEWLQLIHNYREFGKPSWKNLVKALCHPHMRDEQGLTIQRAKEIAKKYPRH